MKINLILKCNRCNATLVYDRSDLFRHWKSVSDVQPSVGEWGKYMDDPFVLSEIHRCSESSIGTAVFIGWDVLEDKEHD